MEKIKNLLVRFKESGYLKKTILSLLVGTAAAFIIFYVFLPPINPMYGGFWVYLTVTLAAYIIPFVGFEAPYVQIIQNKGGKKKINKGGLGLKKWQIIVLAVPLVILVLGLFISSEFLFAREYADIIEVNEYDFATDMPESDEVTNIALMDTDSARALGSKFLGSLSDMISQYTVSDYYTQINYKGAPRKVSNLEYDGFFKWLGNRESGIPGMVMVDPVNSSAEYISFDKPLRYAESAYFNENLERKLRFLYPTKIFNSISFEVDDSGNPYYIVSCSIPQVMLFGAPDITEVIIFNPTDGTSEIMSVDKTPSWVDIVYTGDLAMQKYNWYGIYSGGFINSIIGNVGCKQATDDFGYVVIDDDVWYFTGVTSLVSDDKSNIGFILTNARTGMYKFYPVIGAEEHSAMASAEGELQEKGYVASFPSLISVADQPTYIMVLKDADGNVRRYALVNVENYRIVATATTQAEAMNVYKKLLRQNDIDINDNVSEATVTVARVDIVNVSNLATVYITAEDKNVYKGYFDADESLILINVGDKITVKYTAGTNEKIHVISEWSFATEE